MKERIGFILGQANKNINLDVTEDVKLEDSDFLKFKKEEEIKKEKMSVEDITDIFF